MKWSGYVLAMLVFAGTVLAQTGGISGKVQDATQSPVPNATVTLIAPSTGFSRTATTNETGLYTFTYLQPGEYNVSANAKGLDSQTNEGVRLEVGQTVQINFTLQVGATQEHVTVSASTDLIQPETSDIGQVINQRSVNDLPLNGRNPLALVALVPGVVPQGSSQQNAAGTNNSAYGNFQIGGGVANQSGWILDGVSMVVPFGHAVELLPSQELIQEFKVQTNDLPPEFGQFSGGVVNMATKAGTNEYHGEVYEFLRNKDLNANNFFNNENGIPTGAFTQNQFGGTLGGPIVKDNTFFFLNYEGFRLRQGQPLLLSVPTSAERNGDFSALGTPIYNPFSSTPDPAHPGQYIRQQAQCNGVLNVICPSQINPVSAKLLSLWGLPNVASAAGSDVNNWAGNASSGGNTDQGTARVDHYFSQKQRFFLRYTYWKDNDLAVDPFHNGTYAGSIGTPEWYATHNAVIDDTYTLSPNTIVDLRGGFMRFSYMRSPETAGLDLTTIG
ncbi:MAG: carboxypeptidase regulatory-like domain-containing protein [Acidobacteriaceae bacterium]|nr:carboxypeptidase regulatory-like domain-containing protein [Acidobacteriaceae bacterium]